MSAKQKEATDMFASEDHTVPVPRPVEATAVTVATPQAVSGNTANILSLMGAAIQNGQSSEGISQLVAIYRECVAKDAEAAFNEAKRAFQAECPPLIKNRDGAVMKEEDENGKKVKGTKPSYRFVDLDRIMETIQPLLEKHGFTYDFEQEYASDVITVKCHLSHKAGHTKTTKFTGPWATNAGMSGLQKAGSATTFGQRYALKMALGLPVGRDDDGAPPPHDNAPADENAPTPRPRDKRSGVTSGTLRALSKEWAEVHGNGTFSPEHFPLWVSKCAKAGGIELPEAFAWRDSESWTNELVAACRKDLP